MEMGNGTRKSDNWESSKSVVKKKINNSFFFFFFFLGGTLDSHFHAISANILYFFPSSFRLNLNRITYHRLSH